MTDLGYHFRKEDTSYHIQLYKPHSAPQTLTTITSIIPSTIMESYSWALLVMASLVALAFLSKLLPFNFKLHQTKFPPGPKPWPIIGSLNLIGSHPPQSLHNLAQKYGPIMQLKFGSFPVVVASSSEMAKQFLKTHDHVFASRPYSAAGKYTAYNYQNITWAPSGSQCHCNCFFF